MRIFKIVSAGTYEDKCIALCIYIFKQSAYYVSIHCIYLFLYLSVRF